jgi:hypothetical protein
MKGFVKTDLLNEPSPLPAPFAINDPSVLAE